MKRAIPLILTAFLLGMCALTAASRPETRKSAARKAARYYYMEAVQAQVREQMPEAYEYYKKALSLDPSYEEAMSAVGTHRLLINTDTMQSEEELVRSLGMLRPSVDKYPEDYFEATYYAYLAARIESPDEAIRVFERTDSLLPQKTSILIHLADAYMAKGDLEKAVGALNKYEDIEGKSPQLTLKKVSYLLSRKDTVRAVKEVDNLIEAFPAEPGYLILKGNLYDILGQKDSTFIYYTRAEEMDPKSGSAKLALVNFYKEKNDTTAYDSKIYDALMAEDFGLEEKMGLMAEYLQKLINDKGETARGDSLFSTLVRQYPHEPELLSLASRYSAAKGDYKSAEEEVAYAIDLEPNVPDYWGQLMSYQMAEDKYDTAMATYERACSQLEKPEDGLTLIYSSAASMAKRHDKAEEALGRLIQSVAPGIDYSELVSDDALRRRLNYEQLMKLSTYFNMLGDNYYAAKDIDKAFGAYDSSLFFYSSNALTLNNYAYFLAENDGDLGKAEDMSRQAITAAPDNPTFLDTFAWIEFKLGKIEDALSYQAKALEKAVADGEPSAELYDHYGDMLSAAGREEEALENWKKALELDPGNVDITKKTTGSGR